MSMTPFEPVEILIVEDNPNDAELTIRALNKGILANHIFVAENGEEALDFIFSRGRFSERDKSKTLKVIFLDLKLPKVSGLEFLKAIKSDDATKMLPVVVITSSKEDTDIQQAYALGANSYIVKPVEYDAYAQSIDEMVTYWMFTHKFI